MIGLLRSLLMLAGLGVGAAASLCANAYFYYSLASSHIEGMVYAGLGMLVDAFKLTLLESVFELIHRKKRIVAALAAVCWLFCLPVSLLAAAGFGAQVQAEAAGPKAEAMRLAETLQTQIAALAKEQTDLTAERDIMNAEDEVGIRKAQQLLNTRGADPALKEDGRRGPDTAKAMNDRGKWITARLQKISADLAAKRDQLAATPVPVSGHTEHPVFSMVGGLLNWLPADFQIKAILFFSCVAELLTAAGLLFLKATAPQMKKFRLPRPDLAAINWWREVTAVAAGAAPPTPLEPRELMQPAPEAPPPWRPPLEPVQAAEPPPAPVMPAAPEPAPAATPAPPTAAFQPDPDPVVEQKPVAAPVAAPAPGVAAFQPRATTSRVGARR